METETVTHTYTYFEFSELSAAAKERAKIVDIENTGYPFADDALASLKQLAEHFGGKLVYYEIDWFDCSYSSAKFEMPEMSRREIQRRLKQLGSYNKKTLKGLGECKLTGYCADEDAIDGFRIDFIRNKVSNLRVLMQSAFNTWRRAAQADCEAYYEDDNYSEYCDANDYLFHASGKFAKQRKQSAHGDEAKSVRPARSTLRKPKEA